MSQGGEEPEFAVDPIPIIASNKLDDDDGQTCPSHFGDGIHRVNLNNDLTQMGHATIQGIVESCTVRSSRSGGEQMSGVFNMIRMEKFYFPLMVVISTILIASNLGIVWILAKIAFAVICLIVCYVSWVGLKLNFRKNSEWAINATVLAVSLICALALLITVADSFYIYLWKRG